MLPRVWQALKKQTGKCRRMSRPERPTLLLMRVVRVNHILKYGRRVLVLPSSYYSLLIGRMKKVASVWKVPRKTKKTKSAGSGFVHDVGQLKFIGLVDYRSCGLSGNVDTAATMAH